MDGNAGWRQDENLTRLEKEMVAAAEIGGIVDGSKGLSDRAEMQEWGEERTIRAAVLRHLLIAGKWPTHAKGVRLRAVRISGLLDLEAADLRCPLLLDRCYLDADEPVRLDHASASRVTLTGCQLAGLSGKMLTMKELNVSNSTLTRHPLHLPEAYIVGTLNCDGAHLNGTDNGNALFADGLRAGGSVFLRDGFTAAGAVRLPGADITGTLDCDGAHLDGADPEGDALVADRIKVGGSVFLRGGFIAAGAVRLPSANIAGSLECDCAHLTGNCQGNALVAQGLKATRVFLRAGFTTAGAVRMVGAVLTGPFDCSGANLGSDHDGYALVADRVKAAEVVLDDGFTATGAVRLYGADIGLLNCHGAHLADGGNGCALDGDEMKVTGSVLLDGGFTAAGTVSLNSAHVAGQVVFAPMRLADKEDIAFGFTAEGAQITGALRWLPAGPVSGEVNLQGTAVGELEDRWGDEGSGRADGFWPADGRIHLNGFTYHRLGSAQRGTVDQRLKWIRGQYKPRTEDFAAQPYEQLATVYRQAGQDRQARKVAIARRADLRKYGNLSWYRRFGNWFLDVTIKYGYETWRAGVALAVLFAIFVWLSALAQQNHLIVPVGNIQGLHFVPSANKCTSSYPCFYPIGYAVDTVIPLINVHQADNWGADGATPWGEAFVVATWIWTGLGWALVTLLVAGYTGLVRQN